MLHLFPLHNKLTAPTPQGLEVRAWAWDPKPPGPGLAEVLPAEVDAEEAGLLSSALLSLWICHENSTNICSVIIGRIIVLLLLLLVAVVVVVVVLLLLIHD